MVFRFQKRRSRLLRCFRKKRSAAGPDTVICCQLPAFRIQIIPGGQPAPLSAFPFVHLFQQNDPECQKHMAGRFLFSRVPVQKSHRERLFHKLLPLLHPGYSLTAAPCKPVQHGNAFQKLLKLRRKPGEHFPAHQIIDARPAAELLYRASGQKTSFLLQIPVKQEGPRRPSLQKSSDLLRKTFQPFSRFQARKNLCRFLQRKRQFPA